MEKEVESEGQGRGRGGMGTRRDAVGTQYHLNI